MTMDAISGTPVLVTGATGYVAGWLVRRLLEEGADVHGTVRDPGDADKVSHLTRMADTLPGSLTLFEADLLDDGAFREAMAGCKIVFHTASPFVMGVDDPQRDLVDPAVNGTRNVLNTADEVDSVTRVVLTSSCAAIYGDNVDLKALPDGTLTEAVWNTSSSLKRQPYSYSKTLAEQAGWQIAGRQSRWDLVAINPSLVVGPGTARRQTSESFSIIRQIAGGASKNGVPPYEIGAVDVRDVAEAHLRAGFVPEAKGRHITSARTMSFAEIARVLKAHAGEDWKISDKELPKWLVWLVGPILSRSITRDMVARNFGYPFKADNSKAREELGVTFRDPADSIREMFDSMRESGQLKGP